MHILAYDKIRHHDLSLKSTRYMYVQVAVQYLKREGVSCSRTARTILDFSCG